MSTPGNNNKSVCLPLRLRTEACAEDVDLVRQLAASTAFFSDAEVDVAVELVQERLTRGPASDYHFVFAEYACGTIGYACYGPIACTLASYDLYWIVVDPVCQGQGIGRQLLEEVEDRIRSEGGQRVYVETSSRPQYATTRAFYDHCGYTREATLDDFYGPQDSKAIYVKRL